MLETATLKNAHDINDLDLIMQGLVEFQDYREEWSVRRQVGQEMRPSRFCTMPRLSHKPKPVPWVDLAVKNG
jgi:hypothetical protein